MMENRRTKPKKSLGQNFLQDPNICRKIVAYLDMQPGDQVMEIGPGPGALTDILRASAAKQLVLVEKDTELAARHALLPAQAAGPQVTVLNEDALNLPYEDYAQGWKFIGNLPYNVASPIMWELFSRARGLSRAVFMIQKEVGLRLTASPGSKAYGGLTVWVQSFVLPRLEFIVPPHVFYPRPKVDSAVLSFTPLAQAQPLPELGCLGQTIRACFQMRRKQMGSIARRLGKSPDLLDNLGISNIERPENLTVFQFHQLANSSIFC